MIRHIRFADLRPEPWRNGGGSTVEIVRSGGVDDFDWRISVATINADGPFSVIAGVDRWLVVLKGRVVLKCGDAAPLRLDPQTAPFCFDGEADTQAILPDGTATVLNVMSRRNRPPALVSGYGTTTDDCGAFCFLNTADTWMMTATGQAPLVVERFDALLCEGETAASSAFAAASGIWVKLPGSR